ncbi:MAG: molybdate ABC transporter substrate-binding protein [Vicinamibacteria bacterium]
MRPTAAAWLIAVALALPARGASRELRVAAAADLRFALEELAAELSRAQPGSALKISYGSSGTFFAQLSSRAPFDVFLSADADYPRRLAAEGLGLDAPFVYAFGRLVLFVGRASPLDVEREGLRALLSPAARRIAIANPRHAPYGRAAEAALRAAGLHDAVAPRLVLGENVAQTAQFVQSGAADAGLIALSLALAPQMKGGRFVELPPDSYPRIEQGGLLLSWAREPEAARAFRDALLGEPGRATLARFGFWLPGEATK